MKKLAIALAVGAAAVMGGSVANADSPTKARISTDVTQSSTSTDISAGRRHRHRWGHRHYRSYGYYAPRRHYRSYGYAPGRYYGHRRYYGGGPGVTFSFGTGGYRW
jgi:hypothetical protein